MYEYMHEPSVNHVFCIIVEMKLLSVNMVSISWHGYSSEICQLSVL